MPTVTAADEALSSCSQNAAYNPSIIAAQIRSAKAHAESGNPAMVNMRQALLLAEPEMALSTLRVKLTSLYS